ncbi:YibE/F family protein [Streptomyces boninensis]|uniref:YibE/F family protein n=1 Tax=Streptomyces boninensis TaxID=2039455 RepID=UPI003B215A35
MRPVTHSHSHSHSHDHEPARPASHHLRRVIAAVLIPFAVAVVAGMIALWPGGPPGGKHSGVGFDQQRETGRVTKIEEVKCSEVGAGLQNPVDPGAGEGGGGSGGDTPGEPKPKKDDTCERATIEVISGGKLKGRTFEQIVTPDASRRLDLGQELVVSYEPKAPEEVQFGVVDVVRDVPMGVLAGLFALAVVLVGRLRGMFALVALGISFLILIEFILPAILRGSNPLLVAVVGGSAIMLIALYMCHGVNARTSVAALGTLVSLVVIGVLGSFFIGWSKLTGNTEETTGTIHDLFPDIQMSGLLLAGVLIGSLGVLDDVTVTQTSAVWELKQANPAAHWRELYGSAMRIGRDHIASVVNTLVLAYAGAALPLLLLFSVAKVGTGTVATSEFVAEEIVRTLVGSIGLVLSVPLTTALAALVVSADRDGEVAASAPAAPGPGMGGGYPADGYPAPPNAPAPPTAPPRRGGRGRRRKR